MGPVMLDFDGWLSAVFQAATLAVRAAEHEDGGALLMAHLVVSHLIPPCYEEVLPEEYAGVFQSYQNAETGDTGTLAADFLPSLKTLEEGLRRLWLRRYDERRAERG